MKDYRCGTCGVMNMASTYEFKCADCGTRNDEDDYIEYLEEKAADNYALYLQEQERADHLYDANDQLADRLRERDQDNERLCDILSDNGIGHLIEVEERKETI